MIDQQHQPSSTLQSKSDVEKRHCNKQSRANIPSELQQQIYDNLRQFYPEFDLGQCLICKKKLESLFFYGRLKRHLHSQKCLLSYNDTLRALREKNEKEFFGHVCDYFFKQCRTSLDQKSNNQQHLPSSKKVKKLKKVTNVSKDKSFEVKQLNDLKEKQNQLLAQLVENTNAMVASIENRK